MPTYDYFCEANQRTVEVKHPMTRVLATWGDLCEVAGISVGKAPLDAPVRKLLNGGHPVGVSSATPDACDVPSGMCCGGGACGIG